MKRIVPFLAVLMGLQPANAQITTPQVKAGFGVDADLRSRYFNGALQSGNDDWYWYPGTPGIGNFVIDTTGAADIVARYAVDTEFRKIPFYRTMRVPAYTVLNNRLLIDAVFIRDYHGDDSTVFGAGSNKNGMHPADWVCPVSGSIPDKNDILDMFVHVRRSGPDPSYPLFLFGGVSIENTTGNRYFDFEMYQTDIYYDRASRKFYGYGADAGHTAWQFDAAGNITRPGDIIFTAEYSNSSLTFIEARIWVDQASLDITPAAFNWSGKYDGASSGTQYGYASIVPKGGAAFYTGLQCSNNTWAGPFALVRENNSVTDEYTARQFMEFSVDLTTLGLDPVTLLGGNACGMPFRRIMVKTRSSTSFTAELKDFVGPFDFFLAPRAEAAADVPVYCGISGVSEIQVTNPIATSVYTWTTPDGNIVSAPTGPSITVDAPGTYIVTQQLAGDCPAYATDTVQIVFDPLCTILESSITDFDASLQGPRVNLRWTVAQNQESRYFDLQRSIDGKNFTTINRIEANAAASLASYAATDGVASLNSAHVYYRLKVKNRMGYIKYSKTVMVQLPVYQVQSVAVTPNPAKENLQISIVAGAEADVQVTIFDFTGKAVKTMQIRASKGRSALTVNGLKTWPKGVYVVRVVLGGKVFTDKVIVGEP